jgi:hypothetical protein
LVKLREKYRRIMAGAPKDANVVRLPDDWLIFPPPDGQFNEPRHPDSAQSHSRTAPKILGFFSHSPAGFTGVTWLLDRAEPVHVVAKEARP